MDEVRLYEMYLNEAIEERKADLINRNEDCLLYTSPSPRDCS